MTLRPRTWESKVAAVAISIVVVAPVHPQADGRAMREATALFTENLPAFFLDSNIKTCEINDRWTDGLVPSHIAQKYFGIKLRVHIKSSEPFGGQEFYRKILDSQAQYSKAICSEQEARTLMQQVRDTSADLGNQRPIVYRYSFDFPVFDQTFSKAVVMLSVTEFIGPGSPEFSESAWVFRKVSGKWRLLTREATGQT